MTNIPAIKGQIGNTIYYIANLTFSQIATMVSRVNDELHTANSIKELIQRSLSDNYIKIKDYIIKREDHFFDSLVLAVYDGDPQWREIRYEIDGHTYPNIGLLELNGEEKIFPVDGQHRVEGIKKALECKPEIADETIGVVLIGHKNTAEGRERSRRIFSTLNRYVKPVRLGDIIALDEDDTVAIVTRNMLETYPLFTGNRIKATNNKAIPANDKMAFTSLMTLYACHTTLFNTFISIRDGRKYTQSQLNEYLKFRPSDDVLEAFECFLIEFWDLMRNVFPEFNEFINSTSPATAAAEMRSSESGGNIFFRPIGLQPFVEAVAKIRLEKMTEFIEILHRFEHMERIVSHSPWNKILWNPMTHKMVMRNQALVKYLLLYLYDNTILSEADMKKMMAKYAAIFDIDTEEEALNQINNLSLNAEN